MQMPVSSPFMPMTKTAMTAMHAIVKRELAYAPMMRLDDVIISSCKCGKKISGQKADKQLPS